MSRLKIGLIIGASVITGIIIGGYLFSQSQPRSILSIPHCQNCLSPTDLAGLIASVGIQKFPGTLPSVVQETEKTVVIRHPFPEARVHYVVIPKKDIKDIGSLSEEDMGYLIDAFAVMRGIINQQKLTRYKIYTNGPGLQKMTYLHFHLVSE